MNKNCYRIIFNKKRGLMMAVAEHIASQGKGQQRGAQAPRPPKTINLFGLRPLAFAALCLFGWQPVLLQAAIVADSAATASSRPVVDNTANGLPLVQITTPNSAGLSHNQYNQFNVDSRGAILNNSRNDIQTQQGGYISGNAYLHTGSARIILNEVTGAGASQLRGYTEVAGQRAEVIIANPNGINCDGCGFINTSRGVLTTGIPVLGNSGSLDAFRVTGGQITIGAGGLNGANLDQLDLISRSLQVNGQLWANNLNAITGTNQVNYTDLGVTVILGDANKPTVGIDVALLGGMYANKITLIGTEAGVGVNSQGTLAAQAGDFTLDNQGHITLGGSTTASGKLSITGTSGTSNTGILYGKQNVQITDQGDIANSGTLSALDNLTLTSGSLNSSGILGAGIDTNGNATRAGQLSITTTGSLTATGQNLAGSDITLTASSINLANSRTSAARNTRLSATGNIDNTQGTLQTAGTLTLNSGSAFINDSGSLLASRIDLHSLDLSNRSGNITQSGAEETTLAVVRLLDNTGGTIQTNSTDLSLTPQTLTNDNGSIAHAGQGKLNITSGALSNNAGSIATNGQLAVQTTTLSNRGGNIKQVGSADTVITSSGSADNTGGDIASNGLRLTLQLGSLNNTQGRVKHLGTGQLGITTGALNNSGGYISGNRQIAINATRLDNQNGSLVSNGQTDLVVSGVVDNTQGEIQSGMALNINATSLDNSAGRIVSLDTSGLSLSATGQLSNTSGGLIGGNGNATLNIGSLTNSASITAQNNLVIHADGTVDDNGGTLSAGDELTAYAGTTFSNAGGSISANLLSIQAVDLSNRSGSIVQTGNAATTLAVANLLDNSGGTIRTNSADLSLTPLTLTNDNGTIAHAGQGILNIGTGVLSNNAGNIGSNGRLTVNATRLTNRNGTITQAGSAQTAITSTGSADNYGGNIASNGQITFSAASLDNNAGRITSLNADGLTLSVAGQLDNTHGGLIGGNGNVILSAGDLINSAAIFAQNDLTISTVQSQDNSNGVLSAGGTLNATAGTAFSNTSGSISATHLGISAADLNNRYGNITQIGANAQTVFNIRNLLDNTNGTLRSNSNIFSLTSASYTGANGTIAHAGQGTLNITTGAFNNNAGNIASNGQLTLNAASINNKGGTLSAQKQAQLISQGDFDNSASGYIGADSLTLTDSGLLNNTSGKIEANNSITLNTRNLNNTSGVIQNINASALNITASQAITNNTSGFIGGNGQLTLNAASLDNTSSQIYGKNGLTLQIGAAINNNSGILNTQGNLDISAGGALSNRSGNIEAAGASGTLLLGAASIDNTAGRIANKGTNTTTLNGGASVANYGGTIGGNGSLTLATTSLLNSQQGLLLSGNNLTLNIDNLSNNNGKIYAFSNLGFSRAGAVLDNNLGDISSYGNATYNLGVIHNNGGRITSGGDIGMTSGSLYGNGQIIANRDLSIGLQGDYTYASGNLIASNRDLGFSVTGTYTNQQTLQAPRNLTVNASSITNQSTFNAYNTALNASYITNNGRIDGSNISTSSYRFTNNASIIGDNIDLNGYFLTNQGGSAIIAATNNINLWLSNQLINDGGAEIYSMGNINIGANSSGARTTHVFNQSSLIDASGSISISAVTFDNIRPTIGVGSVVSSVTNRTFVRPPSTTITTGGFFEQDMPGLNGTTQSFSTINGTTIYYESISAPVDVAMYSYTKVVGRTTQNATMLINKADIVSITGSPGAYTITLTNGQRKQCEFLLKEGLYHYNVSYYPGFNPNVHIHPTQLLTLAVPNTTLNEDQRTITTTVTDQIVTSAVAAQAQIRASGNISINLGSTLTNYTSTIAAGNTLSIFGPGGVNNQALSLTSTTDNSGTAYLSGGFSSGGFMGIGATWNARSAQIALTPTISSTSHTAYSSVLTGGNGLVIHAGVVRNSAGGTTAQINGSSLGNGANVASISSATRSSVQSANATLSANNGSAPDAVQIAGIGTAAPITQHTAASASRVAALNLAPVALPNLSVPTSNLYSLHRDPGYTYLVETDHRFTDYKTYTSSDYLLNRLSIDPQLAQKRLGDGFYEQKLISDQITQLTGRRYTGQYTSTEEQTKALMDASVGAAKQLNLVTGIALSKDQAAVLTRDIVWMVEEPIQLADGTTTTALVPRVYLSAQHAKDLTPDGALIAADTLDINTAGDLDNSGTLKSTTASMIAARDILNTGSISSSGDLLLSASRDLSNISGSIAGRRVSLNAGNNLLNSTASMSITTGTNALGGNTTLVGNLGNITASDSLSLSALNNLTILGANINSGGNTQLKAGNALTIGSIATESGSHSGIGASYETRQLTQLTSTLQSGNTLSLNSGGDMTLTAVTLNAGNPSTGSGQGSLTLISGGNLTLDTAKNITSHNIQAGRNIDNAYDEAVLGTNLKAGGNILLAATNATLPSPAGRGAGGEGSGNLNLLSANITSDTGRLTVIADNNVNIGTTDEKHTSLVQTYSESSGFMSSSSSLNRTANSQTYAIGSALSADSINIKSGRDLTLSGSSIAATNDVMLDAGNNLNILAATSSSTYSSYSHTTENGFMSNGGLSFTYGSREQTDRYDSNTTQQSQNRSMVGSINGNLTLKAGNKALISGSDILAGQDLNVLAQDITVNSGRDMSTSTQIHDSKQSGLTVAVSIGAVNAAQTVQQMKQLGGQTKDKRTQALAAATGALAVSNAISGGLTQASVSATYGSSESHSDSTQTSTRTSGSTLNAGGNLNLVATAVKGETGNVKGEGGNITIQGSDIKAGNNISLSADNTINLLADKNTASQVSHNSSSSSGAGAAIGTKGTGFTANAASGRGNADGNDATYTNTYLDAGNQLIIKSGSDTNLKGAVANGKQIIADIGGNLNIESLQDTSVYASKQENYSGSITLGPQSGGSLSASQSNINGNYASVNEQSGFKAGDGGFQVNVKGNTALKGAVIESTQAAVDAGNNTLTTASLTSSDIQNRSEYDAQSISVSGGTNGFTPPMSLTAGDKNESTTQSGISGAVIKITDDAKQKQLTGQDATETIASLNRDVATGTDTSGKIGNNLDVNEVQTGFAVTQAFGQQVGTFLQNKAAEADAAAQALKAEKAKPEAEQDQTKLAQLEQQVKDTAQWGPNGTYRQGVTAFVAAASGNVTSGTAQLVQGATVNYIQSLGAEQVKHIADTLANQDGTDNATSGSVRAALHAIVACTGASAQGSDCGSAALGGSASSLINSIMGGDPATMTAKEKENRTNLVASLVTGIAATTDASNIAAATSAAVIETENNYLNPNEIKQKIDRLAQATTEEQKLAINKEYKALSDKHNKEARDGVFSEGVVIPVNTNKDLEDTKAGLIAILSESDCKTNFACRVEANRSLNDIKMIQSEPGDIKGSMNTAVALQSLVVGGPLVVEALGAKQMATGAVIGGGFDVAGQTFQIQMGWQKNYKPMQTVVSTATGAVAYPLAGSSLIGGTFWAGAANGTNTAVSNSIYGGNDSVPAATRLGAVFGFAGAAIGAKLPPFVAPYISNTVGGIPSFIPLPEDK